MQVTTICNTAVFQMKILETEEELKNIQGTLSEYSQAVEQLEGSSLDERIKNIYQANRSMLKDIEEIVSYKLCLEEHFINSKVIVALDKTHAKVQAVGILMVNRDHLTPKCVELHSLATAYWNIDPSNTTTPPYKVKGAGTAVVKFCSQLGKKYGTQGEIYLHSLTSSVGFYYKLGFKMMEPKFSSYEMFLDAKGAETLGVL